MPGTDKVLHLQCHALYIARQKSDRLLVTTSLGIAETFSEPDELMIKFNYGLFSVSAHIVCGFRFTHRNNSIRLNNVVKPFVPKL